MPKKLLLIRHGRAENGFGNVQDIVRNLTEDGRNAAIGMAEKLLKKDEVPALLISSNAKRASKTALALALTWNIPPDAIKVAPQIYEANYMALLRVVNTLDNNYNFIALVGHNPGFSDLINYLSPEKINELKTSGAALISFEEENWAEITQDSGKLALLIEP